EAGTLDTPERRAAFEARLAAVTAMIADDSVRKHYRRDFGDRLRRLFEGDERTTRQRLPRLAKREWSVNPGGRIGRYAPPAARHSLSATRSLAEPYVAPSAQLSSTPVPPAHPPTLSPPP